MIANSIGDRDSKMVLDTSLLNIQHYKVGINRGANQGKE